MVMNAAPANLASLEAELAAAVAARRALEHEVSQLRAALALARQVSGRCAADLHRTPGWPRAEPGADWPDRGAFCLQLQRALAHGGVDAVAVLYIDLDDFKPINQRHGRQVGDEVLDIVAARLAHALRAGDLVARLGGDEFACLLLQANDRDGLRQLASKLFDAVAAPMKVGSLALSVTASVGIAVGPADGATVDTLLRNADTAMYRARRQQRGLAFFDEPAVA